MGSRRTVKTLALAAVGVATVLSLSGCIKMTGDLQVAPDASFSGQVGFEMEKSLLSSMGVTSLEDFESQVLPEITSGEDASSFLNPDTCTASETEGAYAVSCPVATTPGSELGEPFNLSVKGEQITLTVTADEAASGDDLAGLGQAMTPSIDMTFTFPGAVESVSGSGIEKTADNAVRVAGPLTTTEGTVLASAKEGSGGFPVIGFIVIFGGVLIALIAGAAFLYRAGTKASAAESPADQQIPAEDKGPEAVAGGDAVAPVLDEVVAVETTELTEEEDPQEPEELK